MNRPKKWLVILLAAVLIGAMFADKLIAFYIDLLWFSQYGFMSVIITVLGAQFSFGILFGGLFFLVTCVCLAFSAFYEMIEWWTAVAGGDSADAFLGAQGDIWDSHWDMFLALNGAIISQLVLRKIHDKELKQLEDDY